MQWNNIRELVTSSDPIKQDYTITRNPGCVTYASYTPPFQDRSHWNRSDPYAGIFISRRTIFASSKVDPTSLSRILCSGVHPLSVMWSLHHRLRTQNCTIFTEIWGFLAYQVKKNKTVWISNPLNPGRNHFTDVILAVWFANVRMYTYLVQWSTSKLRYFFL